MITAAAQPTLSELNGFTAKVRVFPISAGQLTNFARETGASPRIVNFYKKFAPARVFENRDDLAASSEQVDILQTEEPQMPQEEQVAAEDY